MFFRVKNMAQSTNLYTNNPSPIAVGRIKFDISQIESERDIIANEGIYYHFSTDGKIDTNYHQLIIGPEDSPYQGGFYLFKAQFPDNYPFSPMTMKTLTQGENVRKHPNLYVCGKCCFSFLGTWSGPPWTPCNNPRSVSVSMRSVMTPFPLENEPGYEDIQKKKSLHTKYAELINWFNIKHAVCGVVENLDDKDMAYGLFKNDIIKQFIKNYSYYISTAEKLLKYETNLIETYGTSLVNSPVYRFSIQFDVKNVVERLKKLYCVYSSSENNIVNSLSVTCESIDKSKQNDEIVINTQQDVNKEAKPKKIKKTPSQKASQFEVGYKLKSENDGCMYEVYKTNGKTSQMRWKKCK